MNPHLYPTYAPADPYGKWRPWLYTAAGVYALAALTQALPHAAAVLVSFLAWVAMVGSLWRGVLLIRDEGRSRRADAEEHATGARPYGIIPPVLPAKAWRRPRFWVLVSVGASVVYGGIAAAIINATATIPTRTVGGRTYPLPPVYDSGVIVALTLGSSLMTAYLVYMAVMSHLHINECVAPPAGWWDGAGDGYGYADDGYGYPAPAQGYAPADDGYGYAEPEPEPAPAPSADPLADFVEALSPEDAARLRAHFGGAHGVGAEPEPQPQPEPQPEPEPAPAPKPRRTEAEAYGAASLDDLL